MAPSMTPLLLAGLVTVSGQTPLHKEANCQITAKERALVAKTQKRLASMPDAPYSDLKPGCAVVAVKILPTGEVKEAQVLRHYGPSQVIWRDFALGLTYMPQKTTWNGLVYISILK